MNNIELALRTIDRGGFVPEEVREASRLDMPVPIPYGQTNSQPSTVKAMLEWLGVEPGDTVLDVGSGSGWTTALLAYLAGRAGRVYAVERVPELVEYGRENCARAGVGNARFYRASQNIGLPARAPYDRILVSAAATEMPHELTQQLRPTGKMVIPVGSDIVEVAKDAQGNLSTSAHPGYMFVPLLTDKLA